MSVSDIIADLKALYAEKNCGPIMIRLSWHDAGVYSNGAKTGGCPNAAMRFTDGGEGCFGANAGELMVVVPVDSSSDVDRICGLSALHVSCDDELNCHWATRLTFLEHLSAFHPRHRPPHRCPWPPPTHH